jgi:hypothetical protein
MQISIKIFAAAVLTIAIPIIASWFALFGSRRWFATVGGKEKIVQAVRTIALNSSSGSVTVIVVLATLVQVLLAVSYRHASTVEDAVQWLVLITLIGGVASLIYVGRALDGYAKSIAFPGYPWILSLLVIVAAWLGRARTQADLAKDFGAVADKLPSASSVDTFLRSFGHASVALAVFLLIVQLFAGNIYFGFDKIFGKSVEENRVSRSRGWVAVFNAALMFLSTSLSSTTASILAFSDQPVRTAVGRVAADIDLLPESACTGVPADNKDRIVFRSDDREQAVVFEVPAVLTKPASAEARSMKPVMRWSEDDHRKQLPRMVRVDKDCKLVPEMK